MELRDFVADTLTSILEGVKQAQSGDLGEHVVPPYASASSNVGVYFASGDRIAFAVNFDVAVTVSDSLNAEGGGKVSVVAASLGGTTKSQTEHQTATRLQFGVPITFPKYEP
jgi:hypothetical protein